MSAVSTHDTQVSIKERLGDAESELQAAETAVGAAVLDGGDAQAAGERVASARGAVEALQAALVEQGQREEADKARQSGQKRQLRAWREISWYAEYVRRLEPVLRLREELDAAEVRVMDLGNAAAAKGVGLGIYSPPRGVNLPGTAVAHGAEPRFERQLRANDAGLAVEDCTRGAARLAPMVERAAVPLGELADPENLPWAE
jgi:hypothetical protein